MKIASTFPSTMFFHAATPQFAARTAGVRSVRRTSTRRLALQMETSVSRKQEIICNTILMLCLISAATVCIAQFFAA